MQYEAHTKFMPHQNQHGDYFKLCFFKNSKNTKLCSLVLASWESWASNWSLFMLLLPRPFQWNKKFALVHLCISQGLSICRLSILWCNCKNSFSQPECEQWISGTNAQYFFEKIGEFPTQQISIWLSWPFFHKRWRLEGCFYIWHKLYSLPFTQVRWFDSCIETSKCLWVKAGDRS